MYRSASQPQWAKRFRVGRIPNIMTTSHQSSPPQAAMHTFVFPDFLLWEMSRVKHETGGNVHHCSTVCNILPHTATFLLQGKSGFFCLNIPCLFTMHISILLCMLIMVHRKMLIEKIDCINKSTDLLLRLRKDYCCSQKEKNGNLGKVLKSPAE